MVDVDLVGAKLAQLGERIARVRLHAAATPEALAADRDALDLVSFNLMLAVQSCTDIAAHIVADEGWPAATEVRGSFERLEQHGVITTPTCSVLKRAIGLRNLVAHGYGSVDPRLVFAASTAGLADLERFAAEVATWIRSA